MPAEVISDVARRKPIAEIIEGLKKRNEDKHRADGTWDALHAQGEEEQVAPPEHEGVKYPEEDIDPADIPFN
jgi:hypothetical protein